MSDIDFDELDRAVNSLITSQPASASSTPPSEPKEKILNIKSQDMPRSASPVEVKPPISPVTTPSAVSPVIERRGGGQFMDVVHPSSNMRSTPLVMPNRATRQQNIAPTQNNQTSVNSGVNAQPRPIPTPVSVPQSAPVQTPEIAQDSPFISDAKVEKRPLGAFSSDPVAPINPITPTPTETPLSTEEPMAPAQKLPTRDEETVGTASTMKSSGTSNEGISKSTVNAESPLPAELQNDLLLIESGSATNIDETLSDDNLATAATVAATSSINQQYTEKPSTGDQKSGAIFDTKAYHKAPMGSAKKKSGWMKIIWILLILIVGAGAGAAVYWFVLK